MFENKMSSITVNQVFDKCPEKKLVSAEVIFGGSNSTYQTACLGGSLLFDEAQLLPACPFEKTQSTCLDQLRTYSIFQELHSQPDIVTGKCGGLGVLADVLNMCSPAMKSLTHQVLHDPSAPDTAQLLARDVQQTCKF